MTTVLLAGRRLLPVSLQAGSYSRVPLSSSSTNSHPQDVKPSKKRRVPRLKIQPPSLSKPPRRIRVDLVLLDKALGSGSDAQSSSLFLNRRNGDRHESSELIDRLRSVVDQYVSPRPSTSDPVREGLPPRGLTDDEVRRLLSDDWFQRLSDVLHSQTDTAVLRGFLKSVEVIVKLKEDSVILSLLEKHVLSLLKTMPVSDLIRVMDIHKHDQQRKLLQEVYQGAFNEVGKRLDEVKQPKDLISLMYLFKPKKQDPDFYTYMESGEEECKKVFEDRKAEYFTKLEERALDLCSEMTGKQLLRLLLLLSMSKHHNMPLINKAVHHLNKTDLTLTLPHAQGLLTACSILGIYNENLLQKATSAMVVAAENPEDNQSEGFTQVNGILYSLQNLRWRDEALLRHLSTGIVGGSEAGCSELACLLQTCAAVDFLPETLSESMTSMTSGQLGRQQMFSPHQWVESVWSCAVLRCLSEDMAASVLTSSFVERLTGETSSLPLEVLHMKLLNINSSAQNEILGYTGPTLDPAHLKVAKPSRRPLVENVSASLHPLAPADRYQRLYVPQSSGAVVDIELFVDGSGRPIETNKVADGTSYKLALQVLGFHDMILGTSRPTGQHALSARLLSHDGYHVVQIPHFELNKCTNEVQRVGYLQNKIKSALSSLQQG